MTVTHHMHKRKQVYQKLGKYPAETRWKRFLDKLVYFAGIIGPLMTLPQIAKIYLIKNATELSLISWASYLLGSLVLLMYSISHKEKPLIIMYSLWMVMHILMLIGILLYGGLW